MGVARQKMNARRLCSGLLAVVATIASSWVAVGHAQVEASYREFAEGRYAASPIHYPADVPVDTVRALVAIVAKQTEERILRIELGPDVEGAAKLDRIDVFTCSESASCNGGRFFRFERRDGEWIHIDARPGFWVV